MLKGKVAIVTGSSAGIGAGTVLKFAKEGAHGIVLHGRQEAALQKVKEQCQAAMHGQGKIHVVVGDITEQSVREKLINETIAQFGRIDILVNNAGISMQATPTVECPIDIFDTLRYARERMLCSEGEFAPSAPVRGFFSKLLRQRRFRL